MAKSISPFDKNFPSDENPAAKWDFSVAFCEGLSKNRPYDLGSFNGKGLKL